MVKCLAQGHKRRDRPGRDSNPHSDNIRTWVRCTRPLGPTLPVSHIYHRFEWKIFFQPRPVHNFTVSLRRDCREFESRLSRLNRGFGLSVPSLFAYTCILMISGDYDGALGVLTEMEYLAQERGSSGQGGRPIGAFSDVLANCQVSRVLLLMLLQVNIHSHVSIWRKKIYIYTIYFLESFRVVMTWVNDSATWIAIFGDETQSMIKSVLKNLTNGITWMDLTWEDYLT